MSTTEPTMQTSAAARRGPPLPRNVATALSYLANLIDDSIRIRGAGIGMREWAAAFLGIDPVEVAMTTAEPSRLRSQLMALAFAEDVEAHRPTGVIGEDQEEAPEWVQLDLGEVSVRVPVELAASFSAGTLILPPCVVQVTVPYNNACLSFRVFTHPDHVSAAEAYLDALRERSRSRANPFKNRTLETVTTQLGLTFKVLTSAATHRDEVVLPDRTWELLDRNVHGLFRSHERLRAAGLATNRGVLLAGPPGTGKTALCRALAHELAGQVTVIFCDAATVKFAVRDLYKELSHLAPALVVMEDVDLVVGDRSQGGGSSLLDFLVALDGAMSDHTGVVTIATTNDPRSIDAAAKRSARFDVLIEVPPPDQDGRARILQRYLAGLDHGVDVDRLAAATAGLSGADLRELVSDGVLHTDEGEPVSTALLVRLAVERRQRPVPGLYL